MPSVVAINEWQYASRGSSCHRVYPAWFRRNLAGSFSKFEPADISCAHRLSGAKLAAEVSSSDKFKFGRPHFCALDPGNSDKTYDCNNGRKTYPPAPAQELGTS